MAALRLDLQKLNRDGINEERSRWREKVSADPGVLFSRLGPQLPCEVKGVMVRIVAFGEEGPLVFDVNTVQEAVMRMVPGISEEQMGKWVGSRPFRVWRSFGGG